MYFRVTNSRHESPSNVRAATLAHLACRFLECGWGLHIAESVASKGTQNYNLRFGGNRAPRLLAESWENLVRDRDDQGNCHERCTQRTCARGS